MEVGDRCVLGGKIKAGQYAMYKRFRVMLAAVRAFQRVDTAFLDATRMIVTYVAPLLRNIYTHCALDDAVKLGDTDPLLHKHVISRLEGIHGGSDVCVCVCVCVCMCAWVHVVMC